MKDLIDAALDINNATLFNILSNGIVKNSSKTLEELNNGNREIEDRLTLLAQAIPELNNLTDIALHHARGLRNRVRLFEICNKILPDAKLYWRASHL